jgi:hypothetical protein
MLKFVAEKNRAYFEKLSEADDDLQGLLSTFDFISNLKHFRIALNLRQYTALLQKSIDHGSQGLSKEENEKLMNLAMTLG